MDTSAPDDDELLGSGGASSASGGATGSGGQGATQPFWVNLYYPGWTQERMPPSEIDYEPVTQIIHFAWFPVVDSSGVLTLDEKSNGVDANAAQAAIEAGHAAGKTVTIAVGGAQLGSEHFTEAISDAHRTAFVHMIVDRAVERGYDGIDVDMEVNGQPDAPSFRKFSRELRAYMDEKAPQMTLTCATLGGQANLYGDLDDVYDQINIMTYDLVWGAGSTWFDAPLYGDGQYYSVDRAAKAYAGVGISPSQIGAGFKFSGFIFDGVSGPRMPFDGQPSSIRYTSIINDYFSEDVRKWDDDAQVPYLSVTSGSGAFITYDDPESIALKVEYMKKNGYGGLILWDASDGYFADAPAGERHPLLKALKEALAAN